MGTTTTTPDPNTSTTDPKDTGPKVKSKAQSKTKPVPGISQKVINELSDEINNMLSFAIFNGITINTEVNTLIQNSNVDDLINAHNLLCKNI